MDTKLKLISNPICPFAQKAWITLHQKKCDFEFIQVSLVKKQAYFTQTYRKAYGNDSNSDGKVPILIDGDNILCESDLISWYVAEKYDTGNQLIPKDLTQRLKMRYFISACQKIVPAFYSFRGWKQKSQEQRQKLFEKTLNALDTLQKNIVLPYAIGENFTIGDILIYPWLQRWHVLESFLSLKNDNKYEKLGKWIENIQQRQSIKATRQSDQYYSKGYAHYF